MQPLLSLTLDFHFVIGAITSGTSQSQYIGGQCLQILSAKVAPFRFKIEGD
ncbi:hypothetical protein LY622_21270 [Halomonas sp. M5N1S17]|uniref:hypothetical protein n=1 Tax=Halomonas alkalisoli TaxID=2907158 RepID=UPI001F3DE4DA|nr:hypothetical protein [Halomonas alkalisoli]MCE9665965.1 hypothetical protein [Halomonas alkalisoli]